MAVLAIVPGIYLHQQIAARRRLILALGAAAAVVLPIAVIAWGITHHGLPTRSLYFRWQYWTGTAPLIENQPLWGVGLNNFGDYYLRYKLPASPEDVKDPHSFFIRWAAEAGVPVTIAVGALVLWMLQGAWRRQTAPDTNPEIATPGLRPALMLGGFAAVAWVPLHFLAETPNEYTMIVTVFFAAAAWAVFAAVMVLFEALEIEATGLLVIAGVMGALAMLLYDQVNMALVTGPVAMLFWMMLGLGESTAGASPAAATESQVTNHKLQITNHRSQITDHKSQITDHKSQITDHKSQITDYKSQITDYKSQITNHKLQITNYKLQFFRLAPIPFILLALSCGTTVLIAVPLGKETFPWDPAPWEYAFIRQMNDGKTGHALEALNAAIARAPNNIELRMQRIALRRDALHQPVAPEIREVLTMDNANAGPRVMLALPDTDLPAGERIAALQQALQFDQQLPPQEAKHLTPEQIQQIEATIARLKQQP
jgi:hypothetical protein